MKQDAKPLSTVYSQEMRDLVSSLLIKDPLKRPDVRAVLKLPFVRAAAEEMLGQAQAQSRAASRPGIAAPAPAPAPAAAPAPAPAAARPERKRTPPRESPAVPSAAPRPHQRGSKEERALYHVEHQSKDD